jgi:hypothetical protein
MIRLANKVAKVDITTLFYNQECLPITHYPQLHRHALRFNCKILGVFAEANICLNGDMSQNIDVKVRCIHAFVVTCEGISNSSLLEASISKEDYVPTSYSTSTMPRRIRNRESIDG